jgi:cell shape-determining protein MreC
LRKDLQSAVDVDRVLSAIRGLQAAMGMSRTNIIALLIFGAILGYFLSFGPNTTQKFKAGVYQLLAPFLTSGSGLKKQITSVRTGLKSLDQLEHENAALQVENRELRATNQSLRDGHNQSRQKRRHRN